MDDPFIREHIEDLLRNIRTQVYTDFMSDTQIICFENDNIIAM